MIKKKPKLGDAVKSKVKIVIKKENQKYKLKAMVDKINKSNIHKEINFGPPIGKELL